MKRLGWVVLIGLFAMQAPFNTLALNVEKVLRDNSKRLKEIKRNNKKLVGQIELLQEQQKYSRKKITELFHLMEYKKSSNVVKETIKRVRDGNRKAKKLYTSARSLLVSGQYNQAIDLFLNYLDIYPDNNYVPDATYWLGRAYTAKGDLHNAKKIFVGFQHDYVSNHKFSNSLYELAVIEHELKEDKRAIQLLKSMIKKFPNHNSIIQAKALLKTIQADQVTTDVTKPESKIKLETTVTK